MAQQTEAFSTAYEALASVAARHPEKIALIKDETRLSYRAFMAKIENTARHLAALGLHQGDVLALYGQNTLEHYFCYFAAAKLGVVFVPVNPNLTAAEVSYTFTHSEAKYLFHDQHVAEIAKSAVPADKLYPVSYLETEIAGEDLPTASVSRGDDAIISYSSGTTGVPKAVMLSHATQIDAPASAAEMWGVTQDDITLVGLPLGYLYGISTSSVSSFLKGATVVVLRRFHPREALDAMISHKVTVYQGVPTMYTMMMEYCAQRDLSFDLSGLRVLVCSGAPLPDETAARFVKTFNKALENYYGLTEVYPVFGRPHALPEQAPEGSVGRPFPGVEVVLRRADGSLCDIDEAGEAFVSAPGLMSRYHKAPDLTAGVLGADGLFQTGDLISCDAQGWYYIKGRLKDIIIRGGHNIAPAEVEKVIVTHPAVNDAAIVGVSDHIYGEAPIAFVVLRHGASANSDEIKEHVAARLSDFKVPREVYFLTELPLGKTGKIDKNLLKAQAESGAAA